MVDFGGNENRFVCPSDRQLALRAKLRTGWSIKTGSLGGAPATPQSPLTSAETERILGVVRRAEAEERREAERVGRLVERLESMRRMALGRGPGECLLCGAPFGVLRGAPRMPPCADCRQAVCAKCGVQCPVSRFHKEVWVCKICAETREMWKKSGAWFFRGVPQYILPATSKYNQARRSAREHHPPDGSSGSEDERRSARQLLVVNEKEGSIESGSNEPYSRQASSNESQKSPNILTSQDSGRWDEDIAHLDTAEGGSDNRGPALFYGRSDSYSASRRGSVTSKSDATHSTDDKTSQSSSSINVPVITEAHINTCPFDASMGTIEMTIQYDYFSNVLHCTVLRVKNLSPMDINGLADPFCKLNILPTNNPSTRLRTKTIHKTRNPEFNETVTFYGVTESDVMKKSLHVLVLNDDKYGYDFLGESKIALLGLKTQSILKVTAVLCGPSSTDMERVSTLWGEIPNTRGQILIALTYSTKRRSLIVSILRCSHLPPMDSNGYSDPFVKLHLSADPHHKKYKTSIKWKTLNPVFNEEFLFETRPNELSSQSLRLTVWDKDYGKSNDYLGGLILGSMSKGKRLKHWLDMIKFPDRKHEVWHFLTEDMVND